MQLGIESRRRDVRFGGVAAAGRRACGFVAAAFAGGGLALGAAGLCFLASPLAKAV